MFPFFRIVLLRLYGSIPIVAQFFPILPSLRVHHQHQFHPYPAVSLVVSAAEGRERAQVALQVAEVLAKAEVLVALEDVGAQAGRS